MVFGRGGPPPPPPPSAADPPVDPSVLKSARAACHAARDAWVACAEGAGAAPLTPAQIAAGEKLVVPPACSRSRAAFEAACSKSWVHHFDALRVKEAEYYRRVQAGIDAAAARKASGVLAGQAQGGKAGKAKASGTASPPPGA